MDLDLKTLGGTYWTLDWFYHNQAVMLVEKFENLVMDSCSDGWNVRDCKANQVQIFGGQRNIQYWWWTKCAKLADLLQTLSVNNPEFALSQLQEHKLLISSETHFGAVISVVGVVFVCLVVWYVWKFLCYHS